MTEACVGNVGTHGEFVIGDSVVDGGGLSSCRQSCRSLVLRLMRLVTSATVIRRIHHLVADVAFARAIYTRRKNTNQSRALPDV